MKINYIDTHAHLNLSAFTEDIEVVANNCKEQGVAVINVGTKESTSARAVELAGIYDYMYAIIGLHPIQTVPGRHDEEEIGKGGTPFSSQGEEFRKEYYRDLIAKGKVIGVGECGFDYFHTELDSYAVQEEAFVSQIELANEFNLPLMIHTRGPRPGETSPTGRSVYQDVYEVLEQYAKVPFNVHFYAGTMAEAEKFFNIGGTISFTGVITFAKDYEDVVKSAPLELIHAETDAPYVAPVPYRGRRCEPWMVQEVYRKIALIKNLEPEAVRAQLVANAENLYRISLV